jgi:hypothetical protein
LCEIKTLLCYFSGPIAAQDPSPEDYIELFILGEWERLFLTVGPSVWIKLLQGPIAAQDLEPEDYIDMWTTADTQRLLGMVTDVVLGLLPMIREVIMNVFLASYP